MFKFFKNNLFLIALFGFSVVVFLVNLRINFFRYNNFDFGKFDLGNMSQMLWNTLHGRLLWLTDYFGTNLPRWSMSHVDPILLVFLPLFAIFQHPMTLVVSQLILVIFSSLLVFLIAELELKSKFSAFLLALAYLFYPAVGYLTAWTGFHGVTAVIPAFLVAFYIYEKMYKENKFTKKGLALFWLFLILTMMGKEQLPLYVFIYGIFIWLFRQNIKQGVSMMVIGAVWFVLAFFIIIPGFAQYRVDGYQKFAASMGLSNTTVRDVESDNYFISRYAEFGDSYGSIALNMLKNPNKVMLIFFSSDKLDNLRRTFEPVAYLPLAFPAILVIAVPDFLINYLTTASGIGTAEITNHRISMVVPIIFISTIYAVGYLSGLLAFTKLKKNYFALALSIVVLGFCVRTTFTYNNPVYLWLTQAVQKRLSGSIAFAKTDTEFYKRTDLKIGELLKLTPLENKDRECAQKIVNMIPANVSVSGPDYLGAHLSLRETYAIFPALHDSADFVIVDVFSKKILTILDIDLNLIRDVTGNLVTNPNYDLVTGCGNLFVFQKVPSHTKEALLPLQEKFDYPEKYTFPMLQTLNVVDYFLPAQLTRGQSAKAKYVYIKKTNASLEGYVLFTTLINKKSGEIYQVANLPSYGITPMNDWSEDRYYIEDIELVLPSDVAPGQYQAYVGMTNVIKTRSIYLGDLEVL